MSLPSSTSTPISPRVKSEFPNPVHEGESVIAHHTHESKVSPLSVTLARRLGITLLPFPRMHPVEVRRVVIFAIAEGLLSEPFESNNSGVFHDIDRICLKYLYFHRHHAKWLDEMQSQWDACKIKDNVSVPAFCVSQRRILDVFFDVACAKKVVSDQTPYDCGLWYVSAPLLWYMYRSVRQKNVCLLNMIVLRFVSLFAPCSPMDIPDHPPKIIPDHAFKAREEWIVFRFITQYKLFDFKSNDDVLSIIRDAGRLMGNKKVSMELHDRATRWATIFVHNYAIFRQNEKRTTETLATESRIPVEDHSDEKKNAASALEQVASTKTCVSLPVSISVSSPALGSVPPPLIPASPVSS